METFADVLHAIIDTVFTGDAAEKAHGIIDQASGTRSEAASAALEETAAETPETPETPAEEAPEEAPPTPGG